MSQINEIISQIEFEIAHYECNCMWAEDNETCRTCGENVFNTIYKILDKYKEGNNDNTR